MGRSGRTVLCLGSPAPVTQGPWMCQPFGRQLGELGSEKDVWGRERLCRHEWAARGGHEAGPWGCKMDTLSDNLITLK